MIVGIVIISVRKLSYPKIPGIDEKWLKIGFCEYLESVCRYADSENQEL